MTVRATAVNSPERKEIFLLLFDISGYTEFICSHGSRFPHAEKMITLLLDAIISAAEPAFTLYEVTGDAVSFYVESERSATTVRKIWDRVEEVFAVFRQAESELREESARNCGDCAKFTGLKLKAVLHHCEVVFTHLRGLVKIAGPDVILAHRLLKNAVQSKEYVIVTSDFYFAGGMMTPMGAVLQGEKCEGFGEIGILVWYPPGRMPAELRPAGERSQSIGWSRI